MRAEELWKAGLMSAVGDDPGVVVHGWNWCYGIGLGGGKRTDLVRLHGYLECERWCSGKVIGDGVDGEGMVFACYFYKRGKVN